MPFFSKNLAKTTQEREFRSYPRVSPANPTNQPRRPRLFCKQSAIACVSGPAVSGRMLHRLKSCPRIRTVRNRNISKRIPLLFGMLCDPSGRSSNSAQYARLAVTDEKAPSDRSWRRTFKPDVPCLSGYNTSLMRDAAGIMVRSSRVRVLTSCLSRNSPFRLSCAKTVIVIFRDHKA